MQSRAGAHSRGSTASDGLTASSNGLGYPGVSGPGRLIEIQRTRILAAMVQESAERGAANVTVAHVVERAGVSRRTFYEIFTDCEDCFLAAFDDAVTRASRYVLDSYDPDAGWVERVRSALTGLLRFLDVERGAGLLLIVGSLGAGTRALERRRCVLAQLIMIVDEGRVEARAGAGLAPLTAEGIVGGVLAVLHARLHDSPGGGSLLGLTGPLMSTIVLPYLGASAARKELARPTPKTPARGDASGSTPSPLVQLEMRLTYRTVRVLIAIAAHPGSSNRVIAQTAGVSDQGQMSKLLARLHKLDLIENTGGGPTRGEPNAWTLTKKGQQIQDAFAAPTKDPSRRLDSGWG